MTDDEDSEIGVEDSVALSAASTARRRAALAGRRDGRGAKDEVGDGATDWLDASAVGAVPEATSSGRVGGDGGIDEAGSDAPVRRGSSRFASLFSRRYYRSCLDALRAHLFHAQHHAVTVLTLGMLLSGALVAWKLLVLGTFSESPVVVVLSGSMEPGIWRGDILFLNNRTSPSPTWPAGGTKRAALPWEGVDDDDETSGRLVDRRRQRSFAAPLTIGDVVVYNLKGRPVPIVHRIIRVHSTTGEPGGDADESTYLLTKGDNNFGDDRGLYPRGQKWLRRSDIVGRVGFVLPGVGMLTIYMNAWPWLKYVIIGGLSLAVVLVAE